MTEWREQSESQREGKKKRSGRLVGATETSKKLAEWRKLQREKREHRGPAEKERVASMPQSKQLASTPEPPLPNGKGTELLVQSIRL